MLKLPIFKKKKLLLAVEYGMYIAQVAQKQNVELTLELMERAEEVIFNEFQTRSARELARDMGQNILAIFQPHY